MIFKHAHNKTKNLSLHPAKTLISQLISVFAVRSIVSFGLNLSSYQTPIENSSQSVQLDSPIMSSLFGFCRGSILIRSILVTTALLTLLILYVYM